MEYLTLKIGTPTRALIYEKDFRVSEVFGPLVRTLVSNLVTLGLVRDGDRYWATITPGDDGPGQFVDGVFEPESDEAAAAAPAYQWLSLRLPDSGQSDQPMSYFTVDMHTTPPNAKRYRKDFALGEIETLVGKVKTSLRELGLTQEGEMVQARLFVVSGDSPRFDREVIHALPDGLDEIKIRVEPVGADEPIPERPMPACSCGHAAAETADPLTIFFAPDALVRLGSYVRSSATRTQESGGILIGDLFRRPQSDSLFIVIEDYVPAERTKADAVSLRFTHETWQALQTRKQEQFSAGKRTLGWYHTHPPIPVTVGDVERHTIQFFSTDDLAVHRQIFKQPWQVALVMDAESDEKAFFRWHGDRVVESGFHICA